MKKHFLLLLLLASTATVFAQDILFVGLFENAASGKSYWCRDMEMVKQIVKTEAEAQQLAIDFKKEHDKENPVTKIFKSGAVVLFDYVKEDKAFKCSYRVIGWKTGKSTEEASQTLNKDKDRIKKEYNGEPKELYAWGYSNNKPEEIKKEKDGFEETYKKFTKNGKTIAYAGFFKNNNTDFAIRIEIRTYPKNIKITPAGIEEATNPNPEPKPMIYTLQPGEKLQLSLDKVDNTDIRAYKVPVGEKENPAMIHKIKILIRESVIKDGIITPQKPNAIGKRG